MMLFWSVVFIVFYAIALLKGGAFKGMQKELMQYELDQADGVHISQETTVKLGVKGCFGLITILILAIAEVIFMLSSLGSGIEKTFTTIFLSLLIINIVYESVKRKKLDLTKVEDRSKHIVAMNKKRTFKGAIVSLLGLAYFVYMFYILVF